MHFSAYVAHEAYSLQHRPKWSLHPQFTALNSRSPQCRGRFRLDFFTHQTNASFGSNNFKSCQIFKKEKLSWLEKNMKESEEHHLSIFKWQSFILNRMNVSKGLINSSSKAIVLGLANHFTHFFPENCKISYSHSFNYNSYLWCSERLESGLLQIKWLL